MLNKLFGNSSFMIDQFLGKANMPKRPKIKMSSEAGSGTTTKFWDVGPADTTDSL